MAPKSVKLAAVKSDTSYASGVDDDQAFTRLVDEMNANRSRMTNTSDVFKEYQSYGGTQLSKRALIKNVSSHFQDDCLILKGSGIASILVFRAKAKDTFQTKITNDDDEDDDLERAISIVAKDIKTETKHIMAA